MSRVPMYWSQMAPTWISRWVLARRNSSGLAGASMFSRLIGALGDAVAVMEGVEIGDAAKAFCR